MYNIQKKNIATAVKENKAPYYHPKTEWSLMPKILIEKRIQPVENVFQYKEKILFQLGKKIVAKKKQFWYLKLNCLQKI